MFLCGCWLLELFLFSCAGVVSVFCLGVLCCFLCSRTVSGVVLTDLGGSWPVIVVLFLYRIQLIFFVN